MSEKYFRTMHLPYSPGGTNDDKRLLSDKHFLNTDIVITEKLDGSNVCLTNKDLFARSHSGPPNHASFDLLKSLHANIKYNIPSGMSVFGEWCYAVHSIEYSAMPSYLSVFGIREDASGRWLSWNEVIDWTSALDLNTVPVLFTGKLTDLQKKITYLMATPSEYGSKEKEGVVVRLATEFYDASTAIAKFVRADHVQTDSHWKHQQIRPNSLKS